MRPGGPEKSGGEGSGLWAWEQGSGRLAESWGLPRLLSCPSLLTAVVHQPHTASSPSSFRRATRPQRSRMPSTFLCLDYHGCGCSTFSAALPAGSAPRVVTGLQESGLYGKHRCHRAGANAAGTAALGRRVELS